MAGDQTKLTRKDLKIIIEAVRKESSTSVLLEQPSEEIIDPSTALRDGSEEKLRSALLNTLNSLTSDDSLPGGTKTRDLADILTSLIISTAIYKLDGELFAGLIQLQGMMEPQIQQVAVQIQQMQQMQAQEAALAQQMAQAGI